VFGYGFIPPTVLTPEQTRQTVNAATLVEPPQPRAQVLAQAPAAKLEHVDRARLTAAALRARRVFPGPVGSCISDELTTWAEFGWRLGGESRIGKLVAAIMAVPLPEPEAAAA